MKFLGCILGMLLACAGAAQVAPDFSLAGRWRFALDRADLGVGARWFDRQLPDAIQLPGTLAGQGIGDDITTNTPWTGGIVDKSWFTAPEYAKYRAPAKVPFWLQPEKYYAGVAWFQRDIEVPADWAGRRVVLFLERAHWETCVWADQQFVGTNRSLSTPHEYDLGPLPPGKHTVTIRVDNRRIVDIGENSHGISDHTQGNWNGLVGRIELRSTPLVWIEELQVYPHAATRSATVRGKLGNATGGTVTNDVFLNLIPRLASGGGTPTMLSVACAPGLNTFVAEVRSSYPVVVWDEFTPQLFELTASTGSLTNHHRVRCRTAFRDIATHGTQFLVNSNVVFFRGTLECAIFPKTGHPPTDITEWSRIIRVAKSFGLNLLRFHSYCPPEAAFEAADELGMYLQVETCWPNQSTSIGDGKPVDQWLYDETDRILKHYGNHPSFVLMTHGNEPRSRNLTAFLVQYLNHYRPLDPRRLWTSGSGWPQLPENQFHVTPDPRIQSWGGGLKTRINAQPPETVTDYREYIQHRSMPVISHEIGQWCVYPNFDEISKYTGYLKPKNFAIFHDRLAENGLRALAGDFLLASGKLQTLCYKEEIESALRTPGMGGFELLDLHDFPGQGTALVGVLDPFWEEKGYVTAKEYHRFCSPVVPLARLTKRVFTTGDQLAAELEIANYRAETIGSATVVWKLLAPSDRVAAEGRLAPRDLPAGGLTSLGAISIPLEGISAPAHGRLVVGIAGTAIENDWDVWLYPPTNAPPSARVLVCPQFDTAAQQHLRGGGNLLLTIPGPQVRNFDNAPVKLGFSSIFWNTAWTGRQAPTTLGIFCDPRHPALADFPTASHSDWQWWYLIHRAGALRLDLLPRETQPLIRVIDDWVTARSLGLVVEGRVGDGKAVICGFDLTRHADDPVSRQMFTSLVRYLDSPRCAPAAEFSFAQVQALIADQPPQGARGIKRLVADSEQEGYEAALAVDGDPTTLWHTSWGAHAAGFPHELTVEFTAPRTLIGVRLLPRQDGNRNGWIKDCEVCVSRDGRDWDPPYVRATLPAGAGEQELKFPRPVTTRFLKLRALSGHSDGPWSSLAELEFVATNP